MPSTIVRGATGQPGPVGYASGITTGIFNELNFVIPDYIPGIVAKYGNSSYMLAMEILGRTNVEEVNTTTNTYSHFEKGRPFGSGLVATAVTGVTAGTAQNVTLKFPQSYNDASNGLTGLGTQSPFLLNQIVKIRSNGVKARVTAITRTTGAFVIQLTPLSTTALIITGTTGTTLNAGEGLETFGNQLAGEASDSQGTIQQKMYRYDNTATVLRASTKSSDLAGMNKTQIDFGDGKFYEPALAVMTMNLNMMMNIEDAVMEGVPSSNAGLTADGTAFVGTNGVLPDVGTRGSEVDYVIKNFQIGDFQNLTNVLDANGGPPEYHFLQDLLQRQDINNLLFGIYKNGAIRYDSVGFSEEAAVSYGFRGFSTDTFDFFFHRYKGFSAPSTFGYIPTQGDYRAYFGFAVPQGMTQDAKDSTSRPYMQWVYQQNPDITAGQRIYSWDLGYTKATKTTIANNLYEQIAYVGSRTIAAEQFSYLRGIAS
jgi:hypothetical protein